MGVGLVGYGLAALRRPAGTDDVARPNILLVTLCSVRADHLGAWGYEEADTPALDRLALEGTVFENAWSSATFTLPSHATILTGRWPLKAGVLASTDHLPDDVPTLPEVLRHYGYRTLAWAPIASAASFRVGEGLDRGFDQFVEGERGGVEALAGTEPWFALVHFKEAHPPYSVKMSDMDPRFREWDTRRRSEALAADRWFVEQLADEDLRRQVVAAYDHGVSLEDARIAALLKHVDPADTVVVVAGDHGQALGERGKVGHQGVVLPEVLHVPLIVRAPGETRRRVAADVGLVDVAPTLWELAGAVPPAGLDGRSLVPFLRGETLPARAVLVQAETPDRAPWAGLQEIVVSGPLWLRYAHQSGFSEVWRRDGDAWSVVDEDPAPLLAEREALSGGVDARTGRVATEGEREALRKEGYW
ncbi:MAG: sulfatase [Myxococcota bacterium]